MGDRIVKGAQYDSEGRLIDRETALAPLNKKGSRRFGRRQRKSHVFLWVFLLTAAAGYGLWALATSLNEHTAHGWGYVQVGEARSTMLSQLGQPCHSGKAAGTDSQIVDRGVTYYVWAVPGQWHLTLVGRPSQTSTGSQNYVVLDKFTANRPKGGVNYCTVGVAADPFNGSPWFLAQ